MRRCYHCKGTGLQDPPLPSAAINRPAVNPFRFAKEDGSPGTIWHWFWIAVVGTCLWPIIASGHGQTRLAMWGAIAVGSVMFCLVTCVKLSQAHQIALLKREQDHELVMKDTP